MKKKITISEFADELIQRVQAAKDIDCCKEEIINLATIAQEHIGDKLIEVNWKED
ncbi:MAG: hypothetical protein GY950_27465 [bacterium]|nr:hypothetical protein [bacterium]